MKKAKLFIFLIVFLVLIIVGGKYYWSSQLAAVNPENTNYQSFVIREGESVQKIAGNLQDQGLIKSPRAFRLYVKNSGQTDKIQAGDFKLSPSMGAEEILKQLTSGVVDKWVTLLEGWRAEEMAEKLNKELGTANQEFIKKAKEGYMFPDTYLFNPEANISDIVSRLENNFDKKYDEDLKAKIKKQGLTPEEGVILASIVEREARSDEARRMVASILLKRLDIGMGLNADATIQYALGYQSSEKSWWKKHLSKEDLKVDSLYNTYLYKGLPPTPISNPSLSSLQAVANASDTPYLYYYHDSKGVSHYSKTLEEHNSNVAKYP